MQNAWSLPNATTIHQSNFPDKWYPKSKQDIDIVANNIICYDDQLESTHPGFNDENYKNRRSQIAKIAMEFKYGDFIPEIKYTKCETNTWTICLTKLLPLHDTFACKQFRNGIQYFIIK